MDSPDVGHEDTRFSDDIGAEVPRIARRCSEHCTLTDLVNVVDPFVFGVLGRFDCVDVFGFQMFQAVSDPVDVLFDRDQHITQYRRAPRARDGEQVGKPRHLNSQIRSGPILPFIRKTLPASTPDINAL